MAKVLPYLAAKCGQVAASCRRAPSGVSLPALLLLAATAVTLASCLPLGVLAARQRLPSLTPTETSRKVLSLVKENKTAEASLLAETMLHRFPGSSILHTARGQVYFRQGKLEDAVSETRLAIKLDAANAEAHWYLGTLYFCLNRPDDGADEWREAVRLKPSLSKTGNCHCRGLAALFKRYPPRHKPALLPFYSYQSCVC